jgi:hypothetical protein
VELMAVMAKYSPFAEKAGMRKVSEQQITQNISEMSCVLEQLGFFRVWCGEIAYG